MTKTVTLKPKNLLSHPQNMRRFYPTDQVQEMANSIAAVGGVLQPLIVVKNKGNKYYVVDGNMRLMAARTLGDNCPPIVCNVVSQSNAEQKISMIVANQIRYNVDPVSEGLHYKALRDAGLSTRDISKRTGVYEARISKRIILANLPEHIQKLIVDGKLPADERAAKALLNLPEKQSIKLADRLSKNPNIKIKTIIVAAEKLANSTTGKALKHPATQLSGARGAGRKSAKIAEIREAAKKTCHSCNQYEGKLRKTPEPAWSMVVHAADATCSKCPLKEMQNICGSCPAVQLLNKLVNHE